MKKKIEISSTTKINNNIKYLRLELENVKVIDINIDNVDFYEANDITINHCYSGIKKRFSSVEVTNSASILLNTRLASAIYLGHDKCTYNIFNRLIKYIDIVDIRVEQILELSV